MERKHRSFVREAAALPESIASTTEGRAALLRQIGQSEEEAAVGARLAQAGDYFQKVDEKLLRALRETFPNRHALTSSPLLDEIHDETLAVIAKAQGANAQKEIEGPQDVKLTKQAKEKRPAQASSTDRLFDYVEHWVGVNESVVVCSIKVGKSDTRYFLIDQSGEKLTDLDVLEKKHQKRASRERMTQAFKGDSAVFAALASLVMVGVVAFGADPSVLIPLAATLGSFAWAIMLKNRRTSKPEQRLIVAIATILATGITAILGVHKLAENETADKTVDVLACKITSEASDWNGKYAPTVKSPQGSFRLDPGIYVGKYYDDVDKAAQALKIGQSYRLTYHGNIGQKYVTSAELIQSIGTCGN